MLGLSTCQPLWVILYHLPENGEKRERNDRKGHEKKKKGQGRKKERNESGKNGRNKNIPFTLPVTRIADFDQL